MKKKTRLIHTHNIKRILGNTTTEATQRNLRVAPIDGDPVIGDRHLATLLITFMSSSNRLRRKGKKGRKGV